jgi:anthranilate/para-aminobenzoate synthase component I
VVAQGSAQAAEPHPASAELAVERVPVEMSVADVARRMAEERALVVLSGRWAGRGAVIASDPVELAVDEADPFAIVDRSPAVEGGATGAIGGGWLGYLGYGVGRLVETLPPGPPSVTPLPDFVLGYYDHVLRFDADRREWWFEAMVTPSRRDAISERRDHLLGLMMSEAPPARSYTVGAFSATPDRVGHEAAIARAVDHIRAGDIYQANITMRLRPASAAPPSNSIWPAWSTWLPRTGRSSAAIGGPFRACRQSSSSASGAGQRRPRRSRGRPDAASTPGLTRRPARRFRRQKRTEPRT